MIFTSGDTGDSDGGYQTQRSLRFRASASAYLSRTPSVTGNQQKWVWSGWAKLGATNAASIRPFLSVGIPPGGTLLYVDNNGAIHLTINLTAAETFVTSAVYRDPSAWYHVVLSVDTTQAVASDRVKLFINWQQVTAFSSTNYPAQNFNTQVNESGRLHTLGRESYGSAWFFDGYLSHVHFIDGQALTPSSFGEFDPSGNWRPKAYTGTYGANGFHLDFSDPTSLTTLMADRSGNGNNWTANNISLTAGATYDSMLDVPLGGGTTDRGNFATLNPLCPASANTAPPTNGNLTAVPTVSTQVNTFANQPLPLSGKWYWEVDCSNPATFGITVGLRASITSATLASVVDGYCYYNATGNKILGTIDTAYGTSWFVTGATNIGVGYDAGTGQLSFYLNGVSQGVAATLSTSVQYFPAGSHESGSGSHTENWNFGQRPFAYTPPTGFKSLHTGNLTNTTVVTSGSYTGNLSANGPCIWCNGTPETLTINGNAVTWGTHADKLANGFKVRTSSSSFNSSGTNTWTATYLSPSSKSAFKYQNAKGNP